MLLNRWSNTLILFTLVAAAIATFIKSYFIRIPLLLFALIAAANWNGSEGYSTFLGLYIPTVIHVYIFTLLFMLFGAKKNKSMFGYTAVGVALLIPVLITVVPVSPGFS